ncbi:unnamed protein product [Ectocarpus sp. 6 AP-2014]
MHKIRPITPLDEGMGWLNPSRRRNEGNEGKHRRRRPEKKKDKTKPAGLFLLCGTRWCVQILHRKAQETDMTIHTNNKSGHGTRSNQNEHRAVRTHGQEGAINNFPSSSSSHLAFFSPSHGHQREHTKQDQKWLRVKSERKMRFVVGAGSCY